MTDHEQDAGGAPTTPSPQVSAMPGAGTVSPVRPRSRGRAWLTAFAAVALLAALLSASVFAAQSIRHVATLAPEVSVISSIAAGAPASSAGAGAAASATVASCHCVPRHSSYTPAPVGVGQVVVVSISKQQLWAYQDGQLFMTSLVTTGMPQLPTPTGTFYIQMKETNVWFFSPWNPPSPYYYTPEHINYAMLFRSGGFYIHDAPWRETFGPGTNVPHTEPDGTTATGSHGCVNMPTPAAAQLYAWIHIGATVIIKY